jgi:predicted amidohydrolase|tara:strand:+ start:3378 stop:4193 length:816 start_codon:yes stop_codon:yes gene_type:complete
MKNFKVACIQIASGPNLEANLLEVSKYIEKSKNLGANIIVLPENFAMISEDDSMYLGIKEELGSGRLQDYISNEARKHNIWIIAGTIPIASKKVDKVYSCCIVFDNNGDLVSSYNKVHLFDVNIVETNEKYKESDYFLSGDSIVYVDTPYCRIGLAICYDLRFPELFRKLSNENIDLVCMPAAFTSFTGKAHWEHLIKARAIENLVYFATSAQGGYHVGGRETYGHSMIVNPWGETLDIIKNKSGVIISTIDIKSLKNLRKNFPCLEHKKL